MLIIIQEKIDIVDEDMRFQERYGKFKKELNGNRIEKYNIIFKFFKIVKCICWKIGY